MISPTWTLHRRMFAEQQTNMVTFSAKMSICKPAPMTTRFWLVSLMAALESRFRSKVFTKKIQP